ncbi:MAG: PadR family transcriptional regulator [Actinomycetota bacterium]|nr:PadR family transcriptional regulator [Actinomycetota bacterium]
MLEPAILGLLKEKPMHGYELKKRLTYILGHFWTVSYGSLYPALKRLEKSGFIERAYSVKEKTRTRNVYRITPAGEKRFLGLLVEEGQSPQSKSSEEFELRMAFFEYLDPATRLKLLERRRNHLEEQAKKFKKYRSGGKEGDRYRAGLFSHRAEIVKSDIRWLNRLIEQEREVLENLSNSAQAGIEISGQEGEISTAHGV